MLFELRFDVMLIAAVGLALGPVLERGQGIATLSLCSSRTALPVSPDKKRDQQASHGCLFSVARAEEEDGEC